MATVRIFEVISYIFNVDRICNQITNPFHEESIVVVVVIIIITTTTTTYLEPW
jgi:hypothetical protein